MDDLDASELLALAAQLDVAAKDVAKRVYPVVKDHAQALRDQWRDNAKETVGSHGPHYVKAITAEQVPVTEEVLWEVGPESGLPQGGMGPGFEFGSRNQAPHWDGTRAAIGEEPKFVADIDKIVRELL
ncbi:hypothetical protein [Nonomuraea sediminis]|uniref:hypothetical protein n=1 Tax=Nonomuraea sediminis TaxID=2835864 RepID=UPI001BDD92C2|nr:hypothetical protein [Nonomuraea sediminis]